MKKDDKIQSIKKQYSEQKTINTKLKNSLERLEKARELEHNSIKADVEKLELLL